MSSISLSKGLMERLKKSITPITLFSYTMGKPHAPCNPSFNAYLNLGKYLSSTKSIIHRGLPLAHTRPGSPIPDLKVIFWVADSNADKSRRGPCQFILLRSTFSCLSTTHRVPKSHPKHSQMVCITFETISSALVAFTNIAAIAYCA